MSVTDSRQTKPHPSILYNANIKCSMFTKSYSNRIHLKAGLQDFCPDFCLFAVWRS